MTKLSVQKLCKEAGLDRMSALPGDKSWNKYREVRFYGSKAEMNAFISAATKAGLVFENPSYLVKDALEARLDSGYVQAHNGYVTIYTPKAHKTYNGPLYD